MKGATRKHHVLGADPERGPTGSCVEEPGPHWNRPVVLQPHEQ